MTPTLSPTAAAAFSNQQPTVYRPTYTQHHRRQKLYHRGSTSVVWNNLPSRLWQDIGYGQFRLQLRTFLFGINLPWHIVAWLLILFEP